MLNEKLFRLLARDRTRTRKTLDEHGNPVSEDGMISVNPCPPGLSSFGSENYINSNEQPKYHTDRS